MEKMFLRTITAIAIGFLLCGTQAKTASTAVVFHYELDDVDGYGPSVAAAGDRYRLFATSSVVPTRDIGDVMETQVPVPSALPSYPSSPGHPDNTASVKFSGNKGFAGFDWGATLPDDEFTIEGFVKVDSTGQNGWQPIYSAVNYLTGWDILANKYGNKFNLMFTLNPGAPHRGWTNELNCDQWYHFALTYKEDGSDANLQWYINGTPDISWHVAGGAFDWPGYIYMEMGQAWYYGLSFDGNIDELRLSNVALQPGDFLTNKTVFHYKMDRVSGYLGGSISGVSPGTWSDYVVWTTGSSVIPVGDSGDVMINPIDNNGPASAANPASIKFSGSTAGGKEGFHGYNYWEQSLFPDDEFTIEGFVKVDSTGQDAWQPIYSVTQGSAGWDIFANKYSNKFNLMFTLNPGAPHRGWTNELDCDKWYHFALTYKEDGPDSDLQWYVNGAPDTSWHIAGGAWDFAPGSAQYMQIGNASNYWAPFDGNIDELRLTAKVLDPSKFLLVNSAPVALCEDVTVFAGSNCTADAFVDNGSYDPDGDSITIVQSPAGPYGLGSTVVTLTVADSKGASSSCQSTVTVIDNTPPTLNVTVVKPILWPPNHEMVEAITYTTSDNCSAVTVSMDVNDGGDDALGGAGNTPVDAQLGDGVVLLRAERSGKGSGRTYTVTLTVTDEAGNSTTVVADPVKVPHDSRK